MRALGIAISCFLVSISTQAQTARLSVLADSVSAGAPFFVSVTVERGPGQQVAFPEVPLGGAEADAPLTAGDAVALSVERFPTVLRDTARVDSALFRMVTFSADTARVGPLAVQVTDGGESFRVTTGTALVPVRSVLTGEAPPYEPAEIGPPEPFPSATPIWIALGVLAALLLGGLVWAVVRWRRRPSVAPPPTPPYPAAIAQLDALDREAPATPEAVEAHVVAVRGVVREYLARQLAIPAREATTDELAALFQSDRRVSDAASDAVRRALRPTDLVAFARVRPPSEAIAAIRAEARAAIDAVEAGVQRAEGVPGAPPAPRPATPAPVS
ncbi:MAG: hypothetical protein AAGK21_13875 [Bacteroidota bacterium]